MSDSQPQSPSPTSVLERRAPAWLVDGGVRSWLMIGVLIVGAAIYLGIGFAASLVIPAVIAGVLGVLFSPLVTWLMAHHVPKILAILVVVLGLAVIIGFTAKITVSGVIDQSAEIQQQVSDGATKLRTSLTDAGVPMPSKSEVEKEAQAAGSKLTGEALGNITGALSTIGSLLFGLFILVFLLYYALSDWKKFEVWLAGRMGLPSHVGERIVGSATHAIRIYFGGLTVSSIIVAIIIGATMWALNLPLALTVAVVTFVTAYIPYVGAIVSGAFAFLVALGAAGLGTALVVLGVVLIAQNVIQAVVQTRMTSESLEVHPSLNFASTILGALVAGAMGAILAAPFFATALQARRHVTRYHEERDTALAMDVELD